MAMNAILLRFYSPSLWTHKTYQLQNCKYDVERILKASELYQKP